MASDEVLIKVAADLSAVDGGFKDLSVQWDKHNADIAKGEKAYKQYADTVSKQNEKVNKAIQSNIDKVGKEGKAIQELEKKFDSLNKKNEKSFDTKKLENFNDSLKKLSANIGNLEQFDLSTEDLDFLTSKLSNAQDDFEALNILVDFFEDKMKSSARTVSDSFDVIKRKIEETKINISSTEGFIKDIDKQIDNTAPGQTQANLISERKAAIQALNEEKIALADYEAQLKKARQENVSMATQLRKVKDELVQLELAGEKGSARYVELAQKAEQYNDVISNTNKELRRQASATEGLDNVIGAVNGIVGAYSAAEGAQALFGDESEDLQKTLVRLNGAIALLNGLQAIQTELTKQETVAGRALTFVKTQYAVATDASAKATTRLAAATKLLGIGLIVGALALIVTYWEDIAKFIGLTSDESERLNAINKKTNEIAGEQVAKLKILVKQVEEGTLTFNQKTEAVKNYNEEFGATLGTVSSYAELEKRLIEQGADYITYLGLKAQAEAAYQLAVEKSKEALEKRNNTETNFLLQLATFGNANNARAIQGDLDDKAATDLEAQSDAFLDEQERIQKELEILGKKLGITLKNVNADVVKEYEKLSDVLASLVNQQEAYRIEAIENGREREKEILRARLQLERDNYQKQIDDLKVSEEKKAKLREEFYKLYNEQTGIAYEQLRKDIQSVDDKYDSELENAKFKALSAIDAIIGNEDDLAREAIQEKWDNIRDLIKDQIDNTNDEFEKEGLQNILIEVDVARKKETEDFNLDADLRRLDREKEIAEKILAIQQANIAEIVKNEELKKFQLLNLERDYLNEILNTYENSFDNLSEQGLFNELIDTLLNSVDSQEILDAGNELKKAFGEDVANEILDTVAALKEVGNEIEEINNTNAFDNLIDEIGEWTSSLESFAAKLADTLGLQGQEAQRFADSIVVAVSTTFNSLQSIFQAEIDEYQERVNAIEEKIDTVEAELAREQQLYEDGYANNYEARKADLEDLKARKKEEEEELQKAQKRKAALQKAEFLIDTVSQLTNLITASTNIFKWASKIPIVGVPLAVSLITTMFGAFAIAKAKAFQAIGNGGGQSFRRGLKEGALSLSGPTHEEKGFGVYNSKTGERVAEFEDGEDVLVFNRLQKKKYQHVIDALIADAQGRSSIDSTLEGYYNVPQVGKQAIQIVRHVNEITVKTQKSKEEASKTDTQLLQEISKFRSEFKQEFEGHRKKEDSKIEAWETKEYYYVKKGNLTKKYPKE